MQLRKKEEHSIYQIQLRLYSKHYHLLLHYLLTIAALHLPSLSVSFTKLSPYFVYAFVFYILSIYMTYSIIRSGTRRHYCYSVINTRTKKVFSKCATKLNALKQKKLLYAIIYNKNFIPRLLNP